MSKSRDYFWMIFVVAVLFLAGGTFGYAYFHTVLSQEALHTDAPLEHAPNTVLANATVIPFSGLIYRDALAYGLDSSFWNATVNYLSWQQPHGGPYAVEVSVTGKDGGFQIDFPTVRVDRFSTLTFAAKNIPGGANVVLFDPHGVELGAQPISWYQSGPADSWSQVSIPLANLGAYNRTIGSVAFTSEIPFTFYLDDIEFTHDVVVHDPAPIIRDIEPVRLSGSDLPYQPQFTEAEATLWQLSNGMFSPGGDILNVGSKTATGQESLAVYTRGANWKDYTAEADVNWRGDSISLLARYTSETNYIACAFNNRSTAVQIYRASGQHYDLLTETPELPYALGDPNQHLAIHVAGETVGCSVNGDLVLSTTTPMSQFGTVGVATWSAAPGVYQFGITNFKVTGSN